MKIVKPVWRKDYAPGFDLYTIPIDDPLTAEIESAGILSGGICWIQNLRDELRFAELLKKHGAKGLSHVTGVLSKTEGIEASTGGIKKFKLEKYLDDTGYLCIFREPKDLVESSVVLKNGHMLKLEGGLYDGGTYPGFMVNAFTNLQNIIPYWRKLPMIGHIPGARVCSSLIADGWQQTAYKAYEPLSRYHYSRIHVHMMWNSRMYKPLRYDKER